MRVRIKHDEIEWESAHLTSRDVFEREYKELEDLVGEDAELQEGNIEMLGGTVLLQRAWGAFLAEVGNAPGVCAAFNAAYQMSQWSDHKLCRAFAYVKDSNYFEDCDDLEDGADNDDNDHPIYVVGEGDTLDDALYAVYFEALGDDVPGFIRWPLKDHVPREALTALAREWNCYPIESGGRWFTVTDRWNMCG